MSQIDRKVMLVGSPGGGIWRSMNGGISLSQPENYGLADYPIMHLEWDRTRPDRLFAVTMSDLYATTNLGDRWTNLTGSGGIPAPLNKPALSVDPIAFTQLPQMFEREQAGVVAVAPGDFVGVLTDRRDADRLQWGQLGGLEDAKRIRRLLALIAAAGARTVRAQLLPGMDAVMAVAPVDQQAVVAFLAQREGTHRLRHEKLRKSAVHGQLY